MEWNGSSHLPQHLASLLLRRLLLFAVLPRSHRICAMKLPITSPVPLQITASPPYRGISSVINKSFSSFSWKAAALCCSSLQETYSIFLRLFFCPILPTLWVAQFELDRIIFSRFFEPVLQLALTYFSPLFNHTETLFPLVSFSKVFLSPCACDTTSACCSAVLLLGSGYQGSHLCSWQVRWSSVPQEHSSSVPYNWRLNSSSGRSIQGVP